MAENLGFENQSENSQTESSLRERLVFPHVEPILDLLEKEFADSSEKFGGD